MSLRIKFHNMNNNIDREIAYYMYIRIGLRKKCDQHANFRNLPLNKVVIIIEADIKYYHFYYCFYITEENLF